MHVYGDDGEILRVDRTNASSNHICLSVPSPMPSSAPNHPDDSPEVGVDRIIGTAATLARHLMRAVRGLALSATLAGGGLWMLLWWPVPLRGGALVGAGLTLGLLLAPAAVLGLFYAGLRDLAALPDRLSTHATQTVEASTETYQAATDSSDAWWGWLRRLLKRVWSLRSLLSDHRALLVRYGAMLRLVTPGFLLLVVLAAGAAVLLLPASMLALLLAWTL